MKEFLYALYFGWGYPISTYVPEEEIRKDFDNFYPIFKIIFITAIILFTTLVVGVCV